MDVMAWNVSCGSNISISISPFSSSFLQPSPKPKFIFFPKHQISSSSSSSFMRAAASSSSSSNESSSTESESSSSTYESSSPSTQSESSPSSPSTQSESSPSSPSTESESSSSARTRMDLLEQLTSAASSVYAYESDDKSGKLTIREQLALLAIDRDDDFIIPLGKNLKKASAKFLTTSQKRNIKRQTYLNEVSQRNDSAFFATIGAFIILPPFAILGIAIATGYVHLFP